MKYRLFLILILCSSFFSVKSSEQFFSSDYMLSLQKTAKENLSSASSLEADELQLLANFCYISYLQCQVQSNLRQKLQHFLAITAALNTYVEKYSHLTDQKSANRSIRQLQVALEERNELFRQWREIYADLEKKT